jgi:RNA polymerase sigma-70 factor (ECF subfamily)
LFDTAFKRLQSKELSEEVVQELFVDIWHKRHTLEVTHSLSSYLASALKYKVLNQLRNEGVKHKHLHIIQTRQPLAVQPIEENLYYDELHTAYEKALNHLPAQCRRVFHLRRYEQRSFQEIAHQLDISVSTAEKHMVKALKLLRADLKDYVVTLAILFIIFS